MWRKGLTILTVVLAMLVAGSTLLAQQQVQRDRSDDRNDEYNDSEYNAQSYDDGRYESGYVRVDRYLDADIWVNRSDNEYFIGDNIKMHYRVNQDAYIAVVSIDSRGRVNLLYPTKPSDNPWRRGGVTYTLPGADDDFDLVVDGPEGSEMIQIIASRERFPIPDWFDGSGIRCNDDEDRDEFMDYLISRYFDRYPDQRFGVDREVIYVNEWEQDYFRPVYYPVYPSWSVCGNLYFDYPWGASIYIDGIYWGCAPLYIPRVLVGWRTITVYDHYGYCWEDYVHVSHYNTIVLNQTVVHPRQGVLSKYKEVREVGYRDPVKAGYTNYNEVVKKRTTVVNQTTVSPKNGVTKTRQGEADAGNFASYSKKHLRGDGAVIKTDRGYESSAIGSSTERRKTERATATTRFDGEKGSFGSSYRSGSSGSTTSRGTYGTTSRRGSSDNGSSGTVEKRKGGESGNGTPSDYYRKKSGTVENRKNGEEKSKGEATKVENKSDRKESGNNSSGSSRSGGEVKQKPSGGSSGGSSSGSKSTPAPHSSGSKESGKGKR